MGFGKDGTLGKDPSFWSRGPWRNTGTELRAIAESRGARFTNSHVDAFTSSTGAFKRNCRRTVVPCSRIVLTPFGVLDKTIKKDRFGRSCLQLGCSSDVGADVGGVC